MAVRRNQDDYGHIGFTIGVTKMWQTHSPRPFVSPVMIGRSNDLDQLLALFKFVQDQHGQCVIISGEAGIGKSRLLAEFNKTARAKNALTLTGHCYAMDNLLPYAPLIEIIQDLVNEYDAERLNLVSSFTPELVKVFPQLSSFFPNGIDARLGEPEQERRWIFEGLVELFDKISRMNPLVLVFEDIHWSDETSLDFLLFLARKISRKAIYLILTYRNDDIGQGVERLLSELDREHLAEEIVISRLNRAELMEVINKIFGSQRLPPIGLIDSLFELTEGNPFFVEEVLKTMDLSGDIQNNAGMLNVNEASRLRVPRSVQIAVQNRIQQLSPSAQDLLTSASVIGKQFHFHLLQSLAEKEEKELLPLIKELVDTQLIIEVSDDQFAFRHALTRDAVYSGLLALERKSYHLKIAIMIERLYTDQPGQFTSDLAYHYFQAGSWEKAFNYAQKAGEHALNFYSPRIAEIQFTRAIEAAGHFSPNLATLLYHRRGTANEILGEFDQARKDYEMVLEQTLRSGNREVEWQVLLDLGLLWASRSYDQTSQYYQKALVLAREIEDPHMLAESLNRIGNWQLNIGQAREAIRFYQDALSLFNRIDDPHGQAQTLELLGMATGQLGDPDAISHYERAIALFQKLDDRYGLVMSLSMQGLLRMLFRDPASSGQIMKQAMIELENALQITQDIGWRSGEAFVLTNLAWACSLVALFNQALRYAIESLALAETIEHQQWIAAGHIIIGTIYFELLLYPTARDHLEQGLAVAKQTGSIIWIEQASAILALISIQMGELDYAESILGAVRSSPAQSYYEVLVWFSRVRLALARNQPEEAIRLLDLINASVSAPMVQAGWPLINFALVRAEALIDLDQMESAEQILLAELHRADKFELPTLIWRLQVLLVRLYLHQKRLAEANQAITDAQAQIERIASRLSDPAIRDSFLQAANHAMPTRPNRTPRQAAKLEYAGLTEREREVAGLVARGKTNLEIGNVLGVSERTIATHVGSILNKLDFASRAQIAVWAKEKGLTLPN